MKPMFIKGYRVIDTTISILFIAMILVLGYSVAVFHYTPIIEKAQGELAITKVELARAKSELATFQAILKQLVDGEVAK